MEVDHGGWTMEVDHGVDHGVDHVVDFVVDFVVDLWVDFLPSISAEASATFGPAGTQQRRQKRKPPGWFNLWFTL